MNEDREATYDSVMRGVPPYEYLHWEAITPIPDTDFARGWGRSAEAGTSGEAELMQPPTRKDETRSGPIKYLADQMIG